MKSILPTLAAGSMLTLSLIPVRAENKDNFNYVVDRFADIEVLRYQVPDFENLSLRQKTMIYYLSEAAQIGRDIIWDQNCRYNLPIRHLLEAVYTNYDGDKNSKEFKAFEQYMKQVWFGNGIHHHYSTDKFTPLFSKEFFTAQVDALPADKLPLSGYASKEAMMADLLPVIFDPAVMAKRVNQDGTQDVIATSANNLYAPGVTQKEVEDYFAKLKDPNDPTPISYGLNSKMVKDADGNLKEEHYHLTGLYGDSIANQSY